MRHLGIFARAPVPGRVKTRLADDVGPSTAADVYWRVGQSVVAAVAGPGYRTTVWYAPPDEGPFVREWLGVAAGRADFRPQAAGTLATRLAAAFTRHFAEGAEGPAGGGAVIVGSDCPGVTRRTVVEAFTALDACDVVLGPTLDGGYYLLGQRVHLPELFRGTGWPANAAAAQMLARVRSLGLAHRILKPLRDMDTGRDARALGLLTTLDGTYG